MQRIVITQRPWKNCIIIPVWKCNNQSLGWRVQITLWKIWRVRNRTQSRKQKRARPCLRALKFKFVDTFTRAAKKKLGSFYFDSRGCFLASSNQEGAITHYASVNYEMIEDSVSFLVLLLLPFKFKEMVLENDQASLNFFFFWKYTVRNCINCDNGYQFAVEFLNSIIRRDSWWSSYD